LEESYNEYEKFWKEKEKLACFMTICFVTIVLIPCGFILICFVANKEKKAIEKYTECMQLGDALVT
jgi:hypothetical protein